MATKTKLKLTWTRLRQDATARQVGKEFDCGE